MTEAVLQAAAVAVLASVCAVLLKKESGELALLLALAACGVVVWLALRQLSGLGELLGRLTEAAGLEEALVSPLYKTAAVAAVTAITSNLARDAGQSAIATAVQLAGAIVALCLALPLAEAALTLVEELL